MSSGIYNQYTGYHNRQSIRLPGYDYSRPGCYFVTICIHDRKQNLLGKIIENKMILNEFGFIVKNEILKTAQMRPNVKIDEYVIMPHHCHIIYHLNGQRRGTLQRAPTGITAPMIALQYGTDPQTEEFGKPTTNSIPTIMRLTKSTATKQIIFLRNTPGY